LIRNPPAAVEQAVLTALNTEAQQIHIYLQTCPVGAPPAVMGRWINGLDQFVWNFQALAPLADWLRRQGLPQAGQRLAFLLRDLSSARDTYIQMYQGMVQTQMTFADIWRDAHNFATANVLAATRYSNAVFAKWQQDMFDITENRCYDCHRFINIPGGGYCLDCARRRGLIY